MNKEEFLAELRRSLSGKMSPAEIDSNIDYYKAYIEGEIMKGRTEEEVLEELGPARLIAKNLTANIRDDDNNGRYESSDSYSKSEEEEAYDESAPQNQKGYKAKKIVSVIIIAVIVILLLFLFAGLFRGIIRLVIRFLPFIVIVAVIAWISRGARGGRG